ncbi:MAG: tRNA (N6-threonylcarbamoyladenosine(37)-N6)-methyltransferase TrmO [Terriglobia bacterium]
MPNPTLRPIGTIRSPIKDRKLMPPFGVPARVELFPEYAPGLRYLEKHSHLWVIAWMHEAERDRLLVTPRGIREKNEASLHGVFAVRSPTRPNPLALTAAKIERFERNVIWFDQLDFIEGTPVIDLKPYFRSRDSIHSARNAPVGQPESRQAMLDSILIQAERFHGELCGGLAMAARVVEHVRSTFLAYGEIVDFDITVPDGSGGFIDGILGLCGVSFGSHTIHFHSKNQILFARHGQTYEYQLLEPGRRWKDWKDLTWEGVLTLEDTELFRLL